MKLLILSSIKVRCVSVQRPGKFNWRAPAVREHSVRTRINTHTYSRDSLATPPSIAGKYILWYACPIAKFKTVYKTLLLGQNRRTSGYNPIRRKFNYKCTVQRRSTDSIHFRQRCGRKYTVPPSVYTFNSTQSCCRP